MQTSEIFCRNIIHTGSAFGIRVDTGEQVFIPSTVVRASNLQEGETAQAIITPNKHANETTPWFVIRVDRNQELLETTNPQNNTQTLDSIVLESLKNDEGYATTAEIAASLGTDSASAYNSLNRLFNQGKIAKADVYAAGGQSRPSFCLWAKSTKIFLGDDGE